MPRDINLTDLAELVGTQLGLSDWILVDQPMIDQFADATHDHQFIHVDADRTRAETSFEGTIAHGFLSLSLLSAMNYNCIPKISEQIFGMNYGFNRIRFISPVRSGARVRGRFVLDNIRYRGADMVMLTYGVTVEIEDEKKPALTAEWLTLAQFDPKDRPAEIPPRSNGNTN